MCEGPSICNRAVLLLETHAFCSHLTSILRSLPPAQASGRAGDLGAEAAAARRRQEREASGRLRVNAFELIASSFNVSLPCARHSGRANCCAAAPLLYALALRATLRAHFQGKKFFHLMQVGAIFEEEQSTSRHVQFSSRLPPEQILDALEGTVAALGGSTQRRSNKR